MVTRYALTEWSDDPPGYMLEALDGDYVLHSDYIKLKEALREVANLAEQYIEGVITVTTTTGNIETDRQAYNRTKHDRLMHIAALRKEFDL